MISILMPLFNGQEYLRDSIASVLAQSFQTFELLIGINGHDQETANRLVAYISLIFPDPRIKTHILEERGKIKTLNKLVSLSQFDIICLLDADDIWTRQKLQKQLQVRDRFDVIGTDANYIGDKFTSPKIFLGHLPSDIFSFQNPIISSSVMMKKADAVFDEKWDGLDDYNLWIALNQQGKTFYNVPEVLVLHRLYSSSFFNRSNKDVSDQLLHSLPPLSDERRAELGARMDWGMWIL